MSRERPHLYLPIEEAARELNARLLLAVVALAKGYRVVIGQQWLLTKNLDALNPGLFFFKGTNKIQAAWMQAARNSGHKVVAIDEEVTAIAARRFVLKEVDKASLPMLERMFIQGQNQYDIYREEFPEYADRFVITGNPRFDLLRPHFQSAFAEEAAELRREYGRYILINTNFGFANTAWGKPKDFIRICRNVGYADWNDPEDRAWFEDFYELESRNMRAFKNLTKVLRRRFPDHKVILRPHPAENLATWEKLLAGIAGVHVVFKGPAIPWMLASDYFIHNTCTTGTEAMVLGVPVGAYAPFTNWVESIFLSNLVTPVYRDLDGLFPAIEQAIADREGTVAEIKRNHSEVLGHHIAGLGERTATEAIVSEIAKIPLATFAGSTFRDDGGFRREHKQTDYQLKKINLETPELARRLKNIVEKIDVRFTAKVEKIAPSTFSLTPQD